MSSREEFELSALPEIVSDSEVSANATPPVANTLEQGSVQEEPDIISRVPEDSRLREYKNWFARPTSTAIFGFLGLIVAIFAAVLAWLAYKTSVISNRLAFQQLCLDWLDSVSWIAALLWTFDADQVKESARPISPKCQAELEHLRQETGVTSQSFVRQRLIGGQKVDYGSTCIRLPYMEGLGCVDYGKAWSFTLSGLHFIMMFYMMSMPGNAFDFRMYTEGALALCVGLTPLIHVMIGKYISADEWWIKSVNETQPLTPIILMLLIFSRVLTSRVSAEAHYSSA